MRLSNRFSLALLGTNAFLVSLIHSAPTAQAENIPLNQRENEWPSEPERAPSWSRFTEAQGNDSFQRVHGRGDEGYDPFSSLRNWDIWKAWEEYNSKTPSARAKQPLPAGTPSGRKAFWSKSGKRYRYEHYSGCEVTERTVKLGEELGHGSEGIVYKGELSIPGQSGTTPVAVKLSKRDQGGLINGGMLQQSIASPILLM